MTPDVEEGPMTMRSALSRFRLAGRFGGRTRDAKALPPPSPPPTASVHKTVAGGGLSALLVGAALLVGGPLAAVAALGGAVVLARRGAKHTRTRTTAPKPASTPPALRAPVALDDPDARPAIFDDGWDVVPAPI